MYNGVLILHNVDQISPHDGGGFHCKESDSNVLEEVRPVAEALKRLGLNYRIKGIRHLTELPAILADSPEEIVFNLIENLYGQVEDFCHVPAVCRAYSKAYTGCDTPCMLLTQDKWRTKSILKAAGLPSPEGVIIPLSKKYRLPKMQRGRYIVKPVFSDASEGIDGQSVVDFPGPAMKKAVGRVHKKVHQPALVEQFIPGRELNVSLLQKDGKIITMPIAEIDFSAYGLKYPHIVDYSAKWITDSFVYNNSPRIIPTKLPASVAKRVRDCALGAWKLFGCQDFARVDFRLDENDNVFILEVNPNPDISPDAGFAAALCAAGISFDGFIKALLENARTRISGISSLTKCKPASKKKPCRADIRRCLAGDRDKVLSLVQKTQVFRPEELAIAQEVFDDAVEKGPEGHYQSFVAEAGGKLTGWLCFGPTPCTIGTFDIYWIAVTPEKQSCGIGTRLMQHAEKLIAGKGGRMAVAETSGTDRYSTTRRFYENLGYRQACTVRDFYAPGDNKVIYTKKLMSFSDE